MELNDLPLSLLHAILVRLDGVSIGKTLQASALPERAGSKASMSLVFCGHVWLLTATLNTSRHPSSPT